MVTNPAQWIDDYAKAGATYYTFHHEACASLEDAIDICRKVKAAGMKPGITINPKTEVEVIFPLLDSGLVDKVLIMTVQPGFGGQKFLDMSQKVRAVHDRHPQIVIQVDGGIDASNVHVCAAAGATSFVCGTSVYKAPDVGEAIRTIRANADAALAQLVASKSA